MQQQSIGIVGGGIGGIAAAVALSQLGVDVAIYEKADALREIGAGMMLWPNATRVLRELGLLDRVVAQSGANTNFLVRDYRGKTLLDLALGRFEVPAVCLRRRDLLQALLTAFPGNRIHLAHSFSSFDDGEQKGGGMALEDALVLARCVADELTLTAALRRYESLRLARTRALQKRSRWIGRVGQWGSPILVRGRRFVANALPASLLEYNLRRVYAYAA